MIFFVDLVLKNQTQDIIIDIPLVLSNTELCDI